MFAEVSPMFAECVQRRLPGDAMKMSLILSIITWVDKLYVMFAEVCPDVY
jgi:hypothetical protein